MMTFLTSILGGGFVFDLGFHDDEEDPLTFQLGVAEPDLPELFNSLEEGGARHKTKGALSGAMDKVSEVIGGGDDDEAPATAKAMQ